MLSNSIKLIVSGSNPEELIKCTLLALKVRQYVKKVTDVQILFTSTLQGFSGIAVEDEVFVECNDDDESIEHIISEITRIVSKKQFMDFAVAAATRI